MATPYLLRGQSTRVSSSVNLMLIFGTNVVVQQVVEKILDDVAPAINLVLGAAVELLLETGRTKSSIKTMQCEYVETGSRITMKSRC